MERFFDFLLGVYICACAYLVYPLSFVIRRKKLLLPQIYKIVISNGLIVWFIFEVIRYGFGLKGTLYPMMFLWSAVAYFILKKKCLHVPKPYVPNTYTPKYKATPTETVRVQLAGGNNKTYGNYNVYGKDLELAPKTQEEVAPAPTAEEKEKSAEDSKLSETRKQLVNFALNVPEDKVDLALKLMRTISEDEHN